MSLIKILHQIQRIYWKIFKPITVGVKAILVKDDQVLLVKHSYKSQWFLPGGGVKKNESAEAAVKRELYEELGVIFDNMSLFGVYSNFFEGKNDHIIVFFIDQFSLTPKVNLEIENYNFFNLKELPDNISPGSKRRLLQLINKQIAAFGNW